MLLVTALALTGATANIQAPAPATPTETVSKVGNIVPLNLLASNQRYAFEKINTECCGPYSQCKCPDFKGSTD